MELKNLILIVVAGINFLMATIILFKNRRSPVNVSFALFFYSASLWTFAISMFMSSADMVTAASWARIYYFAPAVIVVAFLLFANYYLYKLYELDIIKVLYILFPFLVITFLIFHPSFLIEQVTRYEWGNDANEKLLGHIVFALYFISYVVWSYVILFKKLKSSDGVIKKNLILVIAGTMMSFIFGITFDIIYPLLGSYKYIYLGPDLTVIALIFLFYIIFCKPNKNI